MTAAAVTRFPIVALVGNPNSGKTALFHRLTGSKQKVANYAGVTVERKEGALVTPAGKRVRLFDLPGAYGLEAETPDERVTLEIITGRFAKEDRPDLIVCVVDATNLRQHLRLVIGLKRFDIPMIVALNMSDLAERNGLKFDPQILAVELAVPVVNTVAVTKGGITELLRALDAMATPSSQAVIDVPAITPEQIARDHVEVQRLLSLIGAERFDALQLSDRIDRVVLHPVLGPILLLTCLFFVFQAVFSWARPMMDGIDSGVSAIGQWLSVSLPESLFRSLLVDGVIAGVGSVLVFLPQIAILFFFIL